MYLITSDLNDLDYTNLSLKFTYANLKSLIKKIVGCANNSEKSTTIKKDDGHVPGGCLMSTIWAFDTI